MMKRLTLLTSICLLAALSACASNAESQQTAPNLESGYEEDAHDHSSIFPYLGIWFSEDRSSQLIITEAYLYFHDFTSGREVYAQVIAANLVENSIDLRAQNIIHSGQQMGFDSPMMSVQYQISTQGMRVWLNRLVVTGGDQPILYLHDEVLNP